MGRQGLGVPALPDGFWLRSDVRDSLAERDFGALFRLVSKYAGASQTQIAIAVTMTQGQISGYMAGKRQVLSIEVAERILDGLNAPDSARLAFGLAPRSTRLSGREPEPTSGVAGAGSVVDRRGFLASIAPVAGIAAHPGALLWAVAAESAGLVADTPVGYAADTLRRARDGLRKATNGYVTTSDLPTALAGALQVRSWLAPLRAHGGVSAAQIRELYLLEGAACLLLASVSHDFGESAAGMLHAEAASRFAECAGHAELRGWVLCTKAMIELWRGRPHSVLHHAAGAIAGGQSYARRLRGLETRALAQLGQTTEAAARLRQESDEPSADGAAELTDLGAMFTFPEGRQKYYSAVSHALLSDHRRAEEYTLALGFTQHPPSGADAWPISWALARSHLALARLGSGSGPDGAAEALAPVLALAEGQRINQLAQVFQAVADLLNRPGLRRDATATLLHDQIRDFLARTANRTEPVG